jgi:putative SOS response-associated peptidase YedK
MCGRFTSSQRREALAERFQVAVPQEYEERYNLAPAQRALIVRERESEREAALARWGLLPRWATDSKVALKMINARAETLAEKPAFRSLLGKYRCLVVADGFFEWRRGTDGRKEPLYFRVDGGAAFAFAGLWTSRTDPETEERIESCTIITTGPNRLVAPVHDRMPVILSRDVESVWLDPELPREHALSLLEPFDADRMQVAPASRLVNSVKNEGPELLLPDRDQLEPVVAAA